MIIAGARRFQGFSLVELVAVIVIVGVLAATALPRLIDLRNPAHEAAVAATAGAFITSLSLAHGAWIHSGSTGVQDNIDFGNNDLDVNATGWPVTTTDGQNTMVTHNDCVNIWNALMQNPPSVRPFVPGAPEPKFGSAPSTDYQAFLVTFPLLPPNPDPPVCWYVYRHISGHDVIIKYSATAGSVLVDSTIGG